MKGVIIFSDGARLPLMNVQTYDYEAESKLLWVRSAARHFEEAYTSDEMLQGMLGALDDAFSGLGEVEGRIVVDLEALREAFPL